MPSPSRPVALVTGAAKRLGRAVALELAEQGHDIALHYRSAAAEAETTAAEMRERGARVELLRADLANESECVGLVPAVLDRFGRLDAVVHNASHFEYDAVESFSYDSMERHWRANTAPAIVLARALHAHLRGGERRGCVVHLLDQKLWNPNPDYLSYTLSKAALEAATTLLAQALAPIVRVAGVAPGVTLLSGAMSETEFAMAHGMTPLERSSTEQDVARAVRFLIESPAITGTTLLVDGGQHLSAQPRDVMFIARQGATKDS